MRCARANTIRMNLGRHAPARNDCHGAPVSLSYLSPTNHDGPRRTIQAQILELIKTLKQATGTSVILITHRSGRFAGMTDHLIRHVSRENLEQASTQRVVALPGNLIQKDCCVRSPIQRMSTASFIKSGFAAGRGASAKGCPFAPRCDRVQEFASGVSAVCGADAGPSSLCHFARMFMKSRALKLRRQKRNRKSRRQGRRQELIGAKNATLNKRVPKKPTVSLRKR